MNNEGQELYPTLRYRRYGSLQAVEVIDRMTEAGMAEVDAKHPSDRSRKRKMVNVKIENVRKDMQLQ